MSCSKLDQALAAQGSTSTAKRGKAAKPRLVADPRITSSEIADVLRKFLAYKETTDLHAVLCPSKVMKLDWKHGLDPDWITKMCHLAFDLAELAPNSKLRGTKVREAIKRLLDSGEARNSTARDDKFLIDSADLMIRVAMGQYRQLKISLDKREQVLRKVPKDIQQKIKLVLDRLLLPPEFLNSDDEDEEEIIIWGNDKKDDEKEVVPVQPLALVPAESSSSKGHAYKPVPESDSYDNDMEFFKNFLSAPPAPSTPDTRPAGASGGFSPKSVSGMPTKPSRASSGSVGFTLKKEIGDPYPGPAKAKKLKESKAESLTDEALLTEASAYVSSSVYKKKGVKGNKAMKKPSASTTLLKRPAASAHAAESVPADVKKIVTQKKED